MWVCLSCCTKFYANKSKGGSIICPTCGLPKNVVKHTHPLALRLKK